MPQREKEPSELEEAVKELLRIISRVENFTGGRSELESILIEERDKATELGMVLSTLAGIPSTSRAASRFGRLALSNCLIDNRVSFQFLMDSVVSETPENKLKEGILNFVSQVDRYLEEDRRLMVEQLRKELSILREMKDSELGAKDDSEWREEICALEGRMAAMLERLTVSSEPRKGSDPSFPLEDDRENVSDGFLVSGSPAVAISLPLPVSERDIEHFTRVLENVLQFQCFCNFKEKKRQDLFDLIRELALQILEAEELSYLKIIPRLCHHRRRISVESCSPRVLGLDEARKCDEYVVAILNSLTRQTGKHRKKFKVLDAAFRSTGLLHRQVLGEILKEYSPLRTEVISRVMEVALPHVFSANLVRLVYLIMHEHCTSHLILESDSLESSDIIGVLLELNRRKHTELIRNSAATMPSPSLAFSGAEEGGARALTFQDLLNPQMCRDRFTVARIVTYGIFEDGALLASYFQHYHEARVVLLRAFLQTLVDRSSEHFLIRQKYKAGLPEGVAQGAGKEALGVTPPHTLKQVVRNRILGFLRTSVHRLLSSNLTTAQFVHRIDPRDLEKRGIFGVHAEVIRFTSCVLPVVIFSISSLQQAA